MTKHYLYSATVQGIQNFIFQTGKLTEIAGASEYVQQFCTEKFKDFVYKEIGQYNEENCLIASAGKISYLFEERKHCEKVVYGFLKSIQEEMPTIELTQAVVEISGHLQKKHLDQLEDFLEAQRNKGNKRHGLGLMISERSRRTGNVGANRINNLEGEKEVVDAAQLFFHQSKNDTKEELAKKISENKAVKFPTKIDYIVGKQHKHWIAIVHADGNNMGQVVREMFLQIENKYPEQLKEVARLFSKQLDKATVKAAKEAFEKVFPLEKDAAPVFAPARPILLGGDDLTLIIRGDLAIDFTEEYLRKFQEYTATNFKCLVEQYGLNLLQDGLTACAGIAFIKPNYPIHYGLDLADSLTKTAKNVAKNLSTRQVPACLSFHKVHSSFMDDDFQETMERELMVKKDPSNINLSYGPYFIAHQKEYATVENLRDWKRYIKAPNAPTSSIRNWLTELHIDEENANQLMARIKNINQQSVIDMLQLDKPIVKRAIRWKKNETNEMERVTHLYDVLTYTSISKATET